MRMSRFGKFLACSGFPECKFTKSLAKPFIGKCPKCGEGEVVERRAKKNRRIFYGCSLYPKCDFSSWKRPGQTDT